MPVVVRLPFVDAKGGRDVAQRGVEILIGRLITDEAFRSAFNRNAVATLREFVESGYELTPLEISALHATPADVWERSARRIDPRLQKVWLPSAKQEEP